ncbi:hypothetical protein NFI96_000143 [Prochilodus magdalenae]|nr:hypothetical protein NFI96_000143 [Prochilodus magdalenae]
MPSHYQVIENATTGNLRPPLSAAFNTVIPSKLISKLNHLGISTTLCNWISDFLTDRPQSVKLDNLSSSVISLNTGVPQGCVLSPILYFLFTHDCAPIYGSNTIIKYADDTTVIGLIKDNDETAYRDEIQHLSTWCHDNNLTLNTQKTKEIIMDLRRSRSQAHPPVYISRAAVEQVTSFKFLGTHISCDLTWSLNSSVLVKKVQQHLYFLRSLKKVHLSPRMLVNLYLCTIESILTMHYALQWVVKMAQRITGTQLPTIEDIYHKRCLGRARNIIKDSELKEVQRGVQQRIQEKQKEVQELEQAVNTLKRCAQTETQWRTVRGSGLNLISSMEEKRSEVTELIRAQEKAELTGSVPVLLSEPASREDLLQYFCRLTLDPNTVNKHLVLSEENRAVRWSDEDQRYSKHRERFDCWVQVLSMESLSGRCYWEVEWTVDVNISVSYKEIRRKGGGNGCGFGNNKRSWSLDCSSSLFFWHNNTKTELPGSPSSRIGVYVDPSAGTLSFYSVSDTATLLHTVHSTFTQPLYAGFCVGIGSSARLCDREWW